LETRPWKRTAFLPEWPRNAIVPARLSRVHFFARSFVGFGASHFPLTMRPNLTVKNSSFERAERLSLNEIVVPTGGRLVEICTSLLPSRHVLRVSLGALTRGRGRVMKVRSAPIEPS